MMNKNTRIILHPKVLLKEEKEKIRKEIIEQTKIFLKEGGKITVIPEGVGSEKYNLKYGNYDK